MASSSDKQPTEERPIDTPYAANDDDEDDEDEEMGTDTIRGTLSSQFLPPHTEDPGRHIPPSDPEEPESNSQLDIHLRSLSDGDRWRSEVLMSLMMESENIRTSKNLDIPELKNPTISYRMPTLLSSKAKGGPRPRREEVEEVAQIGGGEEGEEGGKRTTFELKVKESPMTLEEAQATADKAIATLSGLDFSAEMPKVEAKESEGGTGGKGKGKEVAVDNSADLNMALDADTDADVEDPERDMHKGIEDSRRILMEEKNGESSSSTTGGTPAEDGTQGESSGSIMRGRTAADGTHTPEPEVIMQEQKLEDMPIPDLWPTPLSEEEAAALDSEDAMGPISDISFLTLTPPQALARFNATPQTSPHYPIAHHILSNAYQQNFRKTEHTPTLISALHHAHAAVSLIAPPRTIRSIALINLTEIYNLAWLHTNSVQYLTYAIDLLSRLLEDTPKGDRSRHASIIFLARLYGRRYDALRKTADLEKSITYFEEWTTAKLTPREEQAARMSNITMGDINLQLGNRLREYGALDKAIQRFERAAALSGDDIEVRAKALAARVDAIHERNPGDTTAIIEAIKVGIKALPPSHPMVASFQKDIARLQTLGPGDEIAALKAEIAAGDGDQVEKLSALAEGLYMRYRRSNDIRDLNSSVEPAEIALAATEPEDEQYMRRISVLAEILQARYIALGDLNDLNQTIEKLHMLVDITQGEKNLGAMSNLSQAYYLRHKHESSAADVDKALELAKAASDGTAKGEVEYAGRLLNLANCYTGRFRVYGTRADIDMGVATMRRALEAAGVEGSSADRPGVMGNLGAQLLLRYQAFRVRSDITEAVKWVENSANETPYYRPHYLERLLNLASVLEVRDDAGDLERSIHITRGALEAIPKGHRILPGTMAQLAKRIERQHGKGEEGFDAAILAGEEAAEAAKVGHPDRAHILATLATRYRIRYQRKGNMKDIERAVQRGYAAVRSAEESTALKGDFLSELSECLRIRHRCLGSAEDLEMSVKTAREALDCTPVEHRLRSQRLIELCERLIDSFEGLGDPEALLSAITLGGLCLEKTAEDDPNHPRRLYIVAKALHLRHTEFKTFWNDLDRALVMAQNALHLFPRSDNEVTRPEIIHLIGRMLRSGYRRKREITTIDAAISTLERAAIEIEEQMPLRAEILDDLARCFLIRYQALGNKGPDGERSFVTFRDAWQCMTARPLVRIRAAVRVCDVLTRTRKWSEAADIYEDCVKLMPRVTPPSLARTDQQALLKMLFGIPLLAANAALEAGRGAERALRLLEMGRGIIAGFTMDCRSDMSDLQLAHPELYDEFNALRRELDSTMGFSARRGTLVDELAELGEESVLARRKRAVEQMDESLMKIRSLKGYENFLLPPTGEEMRKMAAEGPIVVYSSWINRCDAIIVTTDSIRSIRLPKWDAQQAAQYMSDMIRKVVRGSVQTYAERNKKMKTTMQWLWEVVVEPVLTALDISASSNVEMQQIWWVGSGPLCFAPFHAAGIHTPGSTKNTISTVISSYIPSIKALTYARQKRPTARPHTSSNILLITMPTTPGESDLYGVKHEASHITDIVGGDSIKTLNHPSASEVLDELPSCSAVHFACHGISDKFNPSNSALLLQKKDGTQDRLTVQMVSEANTETAQVAYLSACSTAENADFGLADETIHLAGAFMLAGFRNVVATLWASGDEACVEVAGAYYHGLFVDGVGSAVAMHRAVAELRKRRPAKLLMWAPFVHTGA